MRIGHIATGISQSVHLDISKALARAGHEVIVFTEEDYAESPREFTRKVEDGVEIWAINSKRRNPWLAVPDRLAKPWLGRRFFTILAALSRYIRESRCDVYMVESDPLSITLSLVRYRHEFRWVASVLDQQYLGYRFGYPGEPSNAFHEKSKRWMLERANGIRACAPAVADTIRHAGIDPAKIVVVPFYWTPRMIVDGELSAYRAEARQRVFSKHGFPAETRMMLASCRLTPLKGLELGAEALAHVRAVYPHTRFVIAGGDRSMPGLGSYRAMIERAATAAGVADALTFTGDLPHDDVKLYYAAADVHVAPSYVDSFNYSAVEAALAGTPSVLSDNVGVAPWLEECGAAIVVRERDAAAYGKAVLRLLSSDGDPQRMDAMIRCVKETLAPDAVAKDMAVMLQKFAT